MTAPLLKPVNDIPSPESSSRGSSTTSPTVSTVPSGGRSASQYMEVVMVLRPSLQHYESTQDIDYIHRSFVSEYRALGFQDVEQRLCRCIAETALKYNLSADWMNDHADVALPWASECVLTPPPSLTCFHFLNKLTMDHLWFFPSVHKAVPTTPSSPPAKRRAPNDLQRAGPRTRSRSVAVGNGAEAGALREEGPR